MELRPSLPVNDGKRWLLLYGGPHDGAQERFYDPPTGYKDFGGQLCVWHTIDTERLWPGKK